MHIFFQKSNKYQINAKKYQISNMKSKMSKISIYGLDSKCSH